MTKFGNLVLFSMGGFWNPWNPPGYVPDNMPAMRRMQQNLQSILRVAQAGIARIEVQAW